MDILQAELEIQLIKVVDKSDSSEIKESPKAAARRFLLDCLQTYSSPYRIC